MKSLKPISLDTLPIFSSYLEKYPPEISEQTFTNLFVWRKSRPVWFTEICGSMIILISSAGYEKEEKIILGPPIGPASLTEVIECIQFPLKGAIRIPAKHFPSHENNQLQPRQDRDNWDYVYKTSDLAGLAGRQFSKKRNHIKQCLQNYDCEYESISRTNLDECIQMQKTWCHSRKCGQNPGLCTEYIAINEALRHFDTLTMTGGAIRVDGAIQAYTLGERLNPETAVCHFEKALPGVNGLWQLINQWFAQYALGEFKYINREQDLGIPGLRQAKESYYPDHFVEKFDLILSGSEIIPLQKPVTCMDDDTVD
ncbi:MAG: DUF2156 domain-containing protein [Proteobacteria bacterium]|nr:DUF2156 domain-containing protein [Pseudomonadota bacterium]MBU1709277.1 DUF2156 domain-containing protein [Pseudomonadota bacterium]